MNKSLKQNINDAANELDTLQARSLHLTIASPTRGAEAGRRARGGGRQARRAVPAAGDAGQGPEAHRPGWHATLPAVAVMPAQTAKSPFDSARQQLEEYIAALLKSISDERAALAAVAEEANTAVGAQAAVRAVIRATAAAAHVRRSWRPRLRS